MAVNWRPGQRDVMAYRGGRLAVPAVPGAGKTHVLAHLAADLIISGEIKQGKILIVTMMNSAVANFKSRINRILAEQGIEGRRKYEVRTLHSLAVQILDEKSEAVGINSNYNIIDDKQRSYLLKGIAQSWMGQNSGRWMGRVGKDIDDFRMDKWYKKVRDFLIDGIATIKGRGVTEEQARNWLAAGGLQPGNPLGWLLEVYLVYQRQLRQEGSIDFDDMIVKARDLLRLDQALCRRLGSKWVYIFEDEAQDSNPLQEEILRLLSASHGNLVRVGDSNQAIMGTFTAAEPEIFRSYCNDPRVQKIPLLYASRSCQQVIAVANWLVEWVNENYPQTDCRNALERQLIQPAPPGDSKPNPVLDGFPVLLQTYEEADQELQGIASYIRRARAAYPEESIAVLVPTRKIGEMIAGKLRDEGIPVRILGEDLAADLKLALAGLVQGLKYLGNPDNQEAWLNLWREYLAAHLQPEERQALLSFLEGRQPEELLYPPGDQQDLKVLAELESQEAYSALQQGLEQVKDWLAVSLRLLPDQLVLYLAERLGLEREELALAHNLAGRIRLELQRYPDWRLQEIAANLTAMEPGLQQFARKVEEMQGVEDHDSVTVTTCHKAKGLEWDIVFVMSATAAHYYGTLRDRTPAEFWTDDDVINLNAEAKVSLRMLLAGSNSGYTQMAVKQEEIREKLRLFYVAITRARKRLIITRSKLNEWGYKNRPALFWDPLAKFVQEAGGKVR